MLVLYFVVISRVWIAIRFRFANLHSSRRLRVRVCDRERERERERQRERERRAQRELCRSSAILQLICAAIARTVIGFLKITINSLRRPDTVCVCIWKCVCVSDTPPSCTCTSAMYINFNSTTQKDRATCPSQPSPAAAANGSCDRDWGSDCAGNWDCATRLIIN